MPDYLQPEDDGLPMRESGSWAAEKLDYLKRYIDIFETSMHSQSWRRRNYIDLFAGPGKCRVSETGAVLIGSPLISLTTRYPFTDFYFVEMNHSNIETLKQRCSASPLYSHIHFIGNDSNIVVQEIVKSILAADHTYIKGVRSCLNLAFLDPEGLELQWQTVATLTQPYTMDLIIHYPQGGLNRNMEQFYQAEEETAIDLYFGGSEWRTIYKDYRNRQIPSQVHRELMDYYKGKLQDLGYKEVLRDDEIGDEPLIRNAKRGAPLYRLMFASKHPLGHDFWQKVIQRDVYGKQRLL
jgi:three-Cys-motif partner protein